MSEIYSDVQEWNASFEFDVDDVVIYYGHYYFCKKKNNNVIPLNNAIYWADEQDLWWTPSFNNDVETEALTNSVQFGDAYAQTSPKGIGTVRYKPINLKFNLITDRQARAMSIFFSNQNNRKFYNFWIPFPHDRTIRVVSKAWTITKNYENNHTLTCTLEEYWAYEYQPTFFTNEPELPTSSTVRFLATRLSTGTLEYITAKSVSYRDIDASLYTPAAYDILLPYVSNGSFAVNRSYLTIVLKGARREGGFDQTYANNLKLSLLSGGLIDSTDIVDAFVLDGKTYYLAIKTHKTAQADSSDATERSICAFKVTLQFLPFKCNYSASDSKIWSTDWETDKSVLASYSMQNKWATMTLFDAMKYWWNAYYFLCVTGHGVIVSQVANHLTLNQFNEKTFTGSADSPNGMTYTYCWISNGGYRYQSSDAALSFNSNYTSIIPRNILSTKVVIFAQLYIPTIKLGVASWPLSGWSPDEGTYLGGLNGFGSGPAEGNPNRGIQNSSISSGASVSSCKAPNYLEYLYGFHEISVDGYYLDMQCNWCMMVISASESGNTLSLATQLDTAIKTHNKALGSGRRVNGIAITPDDGTINSCNQTIGLSSLEVSSDICLES